eukprot:CAMPEP_0180506388 /NCGR_PEP_ID=MMETSP1036_2-20121128/47952_1 /TAXON_ID=632150 /ORGANISM="Azadinium spinosum, Strain 3D9" /LENGTH=182 /DNA_ID=CAMNT_0022516305 /DNA_START=911 /DNA_END=1459 /DNA_ORIENTATION=+
MVSGAEVRWIQTILSQGVPTTWEVTDATWQNVSPILLQGRIVQLPGEWQVYLIGLLEGIRSTVWEHKQQLVDNPAWKRAAARVRRIHVFARAPLRGRPAVAPAQIFGNMPGAQLLVSAHSRTIVPDHNVDAQDLHLMQLRWLQGVRNGYRIPMPVPVILHAILQGRLRQLGLTAANTRHTAT